MSSGGPRTPSAHPAVTRTRPRGALRHLRDSPVRRLDLSLTERASHYRRAVGVDGVLTADQRPRGVVPTDEGQQTGLMKLRSLSAVLLLGLLTACAQDQVSPGTEDTLTAAPTQAPSQTSTAEAAAADPATPAPSPPPAPGTTVVAAESEFGAMLFDATGQAIYLFDVETTTEPRCYDSCAVAWPPVLTDGAPLAGPGVEQSLLGTTPRTDGRTQVTYGGHPLYFYAHEGKHEVKCHDVFLNGGNWYVVRPDGQPVGGR